MSTLRLFGLFVGTAGLFLTFFKYRGPSWRRSNFILFFVLNSCMIIVSIRPEAVNIVRDALSLKDYLFGRLFALLIISSMFLLFYTAHTKSKLELLRFQFDILTRRLGSILSETHVETTGGIKPVMIIIPAYNESENLKYLLPKIPQKINDMPIGILVIDDGSDDDTLMSAREMGCIAVSNLFNRGGGAALRLGYDILQHAGGHICVTMDADGQHRPEDIQRLIMPIMEDKYDFVIGSRILGNREKDKRLRIIGVYLFGYIVSLLIGIKITDPSSNFRAFKMDAMRSIRLYEDQYHTSELIIEAAKKGMRIGEVPITILKRKFGVSKKGRDWIYGYQFARAILKAWWR